MTQLLQCPGYYIPTDFLHTFQCRFSRPHFVKRRDRSAGKSNTQTHQLCGRDSLRCRFKLTSIGGMSAPKGMKRHLCLQRGLGKPHGNRPPRCGKYSSPVYAVVLQKL